MASDIKQLIAQGEGTTLEFKESFDREAVETAGAFANTNGGVILIGVSDKGLIKGISIGKETQRNWSNQISQAEEFIRKNIRLLSFRSSTRFQRTDKFEYPLDALREAIINGLIHRNYQESSDVRVFIFDDRIEILNPGSFPEGVSPDEPIHKPVNPILSQLMYDVGFIERYGSGIKMMRRLCREWGNKEPRYELHPLETKVIFDSPVQESSYVEIADISEQLNERQKKALLYAHKKGVITRREYMALNEVSHKTAYAELTDMMEKGLLEREGRGRSVKYTVKR